MSYFADSMTTDALEAHILGVLSFNPARYADLTARLSLGDFRHPLARLYLAGAIRQHEATGRFVPEQMWEYAPATALHWLRDTLIEAVFTDGLLTTDWIPMLTRRRAFERAQQAMEAATLYDLREVCEGVLDDLAGTAPAPAGVAWDAPIPARPEAAPLPTGIPALDDTLGGGLRPGRLYIVAGRPGIGKSTLLRAWAWQMACHGAPTAFVTLEVPGEDVRARWQALHQDDPSAPLHVFDLAPLPVATLSQALRSAAPPWRAVYLDYLQLLHPVNPREPRERQVADLSRTLKLLARERQVALVVACQINREAEGRTDHTPRLADLRESGAIEADADAVLLLMRPGYYDRGANPTLLHIILAKHREGPTGTIACHWAPATDTIGGRT